MAEKRGTSSAPARTGVWIVGARGAVATCVTYGLAGLREGMLEPVGLVSAREPFSRLPLSGLDQLVLGGHEVCRRGLTESAGELVRQRVLPAELVAAVPAAASAYEARIRPGLLDDAAVGVADLDPESARRGSLSPREQIEVVRRDLAAFRAELDLGALVMVNLASTEAQRGERAEWADLGRFESALDAGQSQPASVLYAYAALGDGVPFVNFTPSPGSSPAALRQLARERGVPHCGNDGKTGETLLKTVLAPMFVARNLRVLAWQGYNMLGNRDGAVLSDPLHRESKLRSKGDALRSILRDPLAHSHVGIDYVPSLGDWKTAWVFVHFVGFLGARMSLQLTWQGCDSALAAPLVIDLVRLAELSQRLGEGGEMAHTASFFKSPLSGGSHDFQAQFRALYEYAERHAARQR